jgi:hypothetical protein
VRFFKAVALILFLTAAVSPNYFLICVSGSENLIGTVETGHWVKYIGSYPNDEYEWIQVYVSNVEGTRIKATMTYDIRFPYKVTQSGNFPQYQRPVNIDYANGSGNIFLYFIPPNLEVGDAVPVPPGYENLTIDSIAVGEYAGLKRTTVSATYTKMPWLGEGTLYWDQETGVLVELYARVRDSHGNLSPSFSSLKLIETNIWSMSLSDWLATNFVFLILAPASVALQICLLLMLIKTRGTTSRVTRPRAGAVLIVIGLLLLAIGIAYLSSFEQMIFSLSFVFALVFLAVGVMMYSGIWAENNLKINAGVVLISLALILAGNSVACAMYREVGALVPSMAVRALFRQVADVEVVFFHPYGWLATPLASIAISFAAVGIFKNFHKY